MRTKEIIYREELITINLDDISFREFCYLMYERGYMTEEQVELLIKEHSKDGNK